jgi:hypothetical protein
MKTEEINKLLEKYFNGESSEDEELILRRHFEGENISEEFETEKKLFRYFSENANIPEPSTGFEERIISAFDAKISNNLIPVFRSRIITYSSIAAGLLLLFGSYFFFINRSEPKDTFSNPEIAYAETVRILFEVSSQFNQGTKQLAHMIKIEDATAKSISTINKSTRILDNNLKNLDYFQQAINLISSPMDLVKNK